MHEKASRLYEEEALLCEMHRLAGDRNLTSVHLAGVSGGAEVSVEQDVHATGTDVQTTGRIELRVRLARLQKRSIWGLRLRIRTLDVRRGGVRGVVEAAGVAVGAEEENVDAVDLDQRRGLDEGPISVATVQD